MTGAFSQMNWLAVLVATVAHFGLGGVWYMVLFPKQYRASLGKGDPQAQTPGPQFIVGPVVCSALNIATTTFLLRALGITTYGDALLLLLDGLENGQRNRRGAPNVWDISLDKRSTMGGDAFPRLVQQVHRFARVNWRGFNARSTPVTINYSKLICDLVLEIGLDSWNSIVTDGRLREKAWFL